MKKIVSALAALALVLSLSAVAFCAGKFFPGFSIPGRHGCRYYADALAVVSVDESGEDYEITTKDANGNLWSFYALDGDYFPGDIVAVIMSDNGTPDWVYDDQIITQRYAGYGTPAAW